MENRCHRLRAAVKELYERFRGKPLFDSYEILTPKVQVSGEVALLTYLLAQHTGTVHHLLERNPGVPDEEGRLAGDTHALVQGQRAAAMSDRFPNAFIGRTERPDADLAGALGAAAAVGRAGRRHGGPTRRGRARLEECVVVAALCLRLGNGGQ